MSRKARPHQHHQPRHLPPLSADAEIGLAWFTRDAWHRLVAVADDREALDDTFEEWERTALAAIQDLETLGRRIRKVLIDIDALVTWCRENHRRIDSAARSDFVIHLLQSGSG
jgi:hypothetical protein